MLVSDVHRVDMQSICGLFGYIWYDGLFTEISRQSDERRGSM